MVDPKSSNISPVATILTEQIWFKFFRCFPAKIRAMLYPNPKLKKKKTKSELPVHEIYLIKRFGE